MEQLVLKASMLDRYKVRIGIVCYPREYEITGLPSQEARSDGGGGWNVVILQRAYGLLISHQIGGWLSLLLDIFIPELLIPAPPPPPRSCGTQPEHVVGHQFFY
jgi:hypothetical protein